MVEYLFAEVSSVYVGVYLCCGYGFVAEHGLYGAQIGSAFEQGSGEGVAEGVW